MAIRRCPFTAAPGFTLIEMVIATSIIGILTTIGTPMYVSALRTARVQKAISELRVISQEIDIYRATNDMHLPVSLHQVGFGGRLDPWGVPYCYLNYELGTGDGLDWAVGAGLVDPSAVLKETGAGGSGGSTLGGGGGGGGIGTMISAVALHLSAREVTELVASLKGKPLFASVPVATTRRSDRYLFPLNSDYDLFTLGPNGMTATSLGHSLSQDDIIRANDGAFFGMASSY